MHSLPLIFNRLLEKREATMDCVTPLLCLVLLLLVAQLKANIQRPW